MAENESMEGKDYALEKKKEFEEQVFQAVKKLKSGETTTSIEGLQVTNYGNQYTLKLKGITFGIIGEDGKFTYNRENFKKLKQILDQENITLESLGLPDLEQAIDQEELEQKEDEKIEQEENDGEEQQEEKDDEKPELQDNPEEEKDEKQEKLAKQYGVNARQVIHISKSKKITREDFGQVANWSKEYDDIFIVPGEDEYSKKFIGIKNGQEEEIQSMQKTVNGKNASGITIKKVDGEQITEVSPLAMYEIDDKTAVAIVRDNYGKPQALYCRQEGGDRKTFWGSIIPEASGNNIEQQGTEERSFMDYRNNSSNDLANKADALARQDDLEKRGTPSDKAGVQVKEIEGSSIQNRQLNIDEIVEDLMRKDGIVDKLTVPPGYYEHKAEKILNMMEDNENIMYEEAIDRVDEENKREEGGRTPGEKMDRRG